MTHDEQRFEKIREAKRAVQRLLRDKENVHAVSIGHKEVDGKRTDELAIVVHVTNKVPEDELDYDNLVPHYLTLASGDDIPTDVKESDIPTTDSSSTPYRTQSHNPVFGGIILRPAGSDGSGTLGVPVEKQDGSVYLLTNRHVATTVSTTPSVGEEIYQGSEETAATLEEWSTISDTEVNYADSALLSPVSGVDTANHIASLGPMGDPVTPSMGDDCVTSGMTGTTGTSTITELDYTGAVGYEDGDYTAEFEGLILLGDPSVAQPGYSGSVWGRYDEQTDTVHPVGVLFARSDATGNQLCTPWTAIEDVHGSLSPVSSSNDTSLNPISVVRETELTPIALETGTRSLIHCVAAQHGPPSDLPNETVELRSGELDSSGNATGDVIDTAQVTNGWGEPQRIAFSGIEEALGSGLHLVSVEMTYGDDEQYEILVPEPTEHRVYGSITDPDGNSIADATVDVYTQN